MNRPQRNNNPLNLRYAGQTGAVPDKDGYAVFPTPSAGWRAAHRQIQRDQERDLSLQAFILKFAPPNENDVENYTKFIMKELNVEQDKPLKHLSVYALAGVMAQMEGYYA